MTIIYDEVWITTRREVLVCLDAIRSYKKDLARMEAKYGIKTEELVKKIEEEGYEPDREERRWYEVYLGLKRTEERLEGLKRFLERG